MATVEERVTTLEDIVRKHDRSIELLIQLAETNTRVQQQSVQTMENLTTRFGHLEEATRAVVTAAEAMRTEMGAMRTDMGAMRTEMGAMRTEMGAMRTDTAEFRTQVGVWALTVEQRFDALPTVMAKVVADELRPVTAALNALPDAIAKAVAEEFRPVLSVREDVEDLKRRVNALEKKPTN